MEELKNKQDTALSVEPVDKTATVCSEGTVVENEEQQGPKIHSATDSRGHLILAGLVATAILSCIALLVAGAIQLTSRWLITCPTDLPVNDPAPILWSDLISDRVAPTSLGVPKEVAKEVRLKGFPPVRSSEQHR